MDKILEKYKSDLEKALLEKGWENKIPSFDELATHKAKVLVVLQDPGHSGAEKSRTCSIDNDDPTARKQKEILSELGIDRQDVLFWNFYAAFGLNTNKLTKEDKNFWAKKLNDLVNLLPNLECIISLGNRSWSGFKYFPNDKMIRLLFAPHPSIRGRSRPGYEGRLWHTWRNVKKHIQSESVCIRDSKI